MREVRPSGRKDGRVFFSGIIKLSPVFSYFTQYRRRHITAQKTDGQKEYPLPLQTA